MRKPSMSCPMSGLSIVATFNQRKPVLCRATNEVFRECLGNLRPTNQDISDMITKYCNNSKDAFRTMIACGDAVDQ
jgi:hypothetical protein